MTEPFTLRPVTRCDDVDLMRMLSDENVVRYLGVRRLRYYQDVNDLIDQYINSPSRWLAVHDGESQFLGLIGLERQGHSVALTIMSNGRMPGFGRKVSVPVVETLFAQPGVRRVWAYCHVDNLPVQRVLARMGAECEGRLRKFAMFPNLSDEPQDVYVYGIVR